MEPQGKEDLARLSAPLKRHTAHGAVPSAVCRSAVGGSRCLVPRCQTAHIAEVLLEDRQTPLCINNNNMLSTLLTWI